MIHIDGRSVAELSDDDLPRLRRDRIGFIFQFFNLLPSLSCVEYAALPLHVKGLGRKEIDGRARELLELVQLSDRLDHLPDELSGGERQRVAIARSLAFSPPILLADGPTGNPDTHHTGAEILDLIRDLHQRLVATVLIVTHDAGVAESCARAVTLPMPASPETFANDPATSHQLALRPQTPAPLPAYYRGHRAGRCAARGHADRQPQRVARLQSNGGADSRQIAVSSNRSQPAIQALPRKFWSACNPCPTCGRQHPLLNPVWTRV